MDSKQKRNREKKTKQLVVGELRKYQALKVKIENQREQQNFGIALFPSINKTNENMEAAEMERLHVLQVERALATVDTIERAIIEKKYLAADEINDLDIYMELGIKKGKYYEKKKSAVQQLATALGIV